MKSSSLKPSEGIPLKVDQDFIESYTGDEDEIIKKYKKRIRMGEKISMIAIIIAILMVSIFIPIQLGWLG